MKTAYQWCLEANLRLKNLGQWTSIKNYFEEKISVERFYEILKNCAVTNEMPLKTDEYLEYRMYGLVPYNISPIQQAIQFGHAVVEYGRSCDGFTSLQRTYNLWADKHKTFIILNGGTTNKDPEKLGTLNQHLITLENENIVFDKFYEPDLGDQLTAIVFIVDERVFNKKLYPDFILELPSSSNPSEKELSHLEKKNNDRYDAWVKLIGGPKNAFLRDFLSGFRLA